MKHIIAAVATALAVWAVIFMINLDREADRYGQIEEIIEKSKLEVPVRKNVVESTKNGKSVTTDTRAEKEEDEAAKKLKALRDRAGSAMAFKVSPLYKQRCSSCHGVNGEGIIGPKLIGMSREKVRKALSDFKSGTRKNYVMYGLLAKMKESELDALSSEIATFQSKLKSAEK